MSEWYAEYYGPRYADSVRAMLTPERSRAEVDFIRRETGLEPPAAIADVACGEGRHALAWAERGFAVTGVDLNAEFIERARTAQRETPATTAAARFEPGDMRQPIGGPYALVEILFHSFGFFTDDENRAVLRGWSERLVPGGWLVLDVWNRDAIVRNLQPERTWRTADDLEVREQYAFDPLTGRSAVHYTYTYADGRCYDYDASFRLYTFTELRDLLASAEMSVIAVFGSLAGDAYTLDARRLVVFARKK